MNRHKIMDLNKYLSKTDFKLARECPTKLYYTRKKYPSEKNLDEYMEMLKEGGFIIGEIARIIHPNGVYIGLSEGVEKGIRRTKEELCKDKVTLFEAVFECNGLLAVVDILEKKGSDINLIEVKSKSYDSKKENQIIGQRGGILKQWQEYIEDVAYQKIVLQKSLPEFSIVAYMLLPDKAKKNHIQGLAGYFQLEKHSKGESNFYKVKFNGEADLILKNHFLTRVNVDEACDFLKAQLLPEALKFLDSLRPELKKIQNHLGKHCMDCEFISHDRSLSGYHQCWKELAEVKPHIFELYHGGSLKEKGRFLVDLLLSEGKASLFDIPLEAIKGKRGARQSIQIEYTRKNKEWINPAFKSQLLGFKYPLHFIDFETATSAVPYNKDMRPYEQAAFQWSCHTVNSPESEPVHNAWIARDSSFPSFKFAETLMKEISDQGTVFMWANHEQSALKIIRGQMLEYNYDQPDLLSWIDSMVSSEESEGRFVDLARLCLEHYFHPQMKGRISIKDVLPAVWNNNSYLWDNKFFRRYYKRDAQGNLLSPYDVLEDIEIGGVGKVIKGGTGAMQAYQEMIYGLSKNDPEKRQKYTQLLLQYCELDTVAMMIIYTHWRRLFALN